MTIELAMVVENISINDLKDMRKRFYGVTMKTGSQYKILNLIIDKIESRIEYLESENDHKLNAFESKSSEP